MARLRSGSKWELGQQPAWRLSDDEVHLLGETSFFVRDGFVDDALVREARGDIDQLAETERLRPAGFSRGVNFRIEDQVRGDLITWLDPDQIDPDQLDPDQLDPDQLDPDQLGADDASPGLAKVHARFEALRAELNEAAYLGLDYFEVQIAQYPGAGAGYDRHVDAFPGSANRRVTAILYLNQGWTPEQGGVLRAWMPDGEVIEVEPVAGRLVVFMSDKVPHQVMPTFAPRCAVTAWYRHRSAVVR
jgi:SM-20-related protein